MESVNYCTGGINVTVYRAIMRKSGFSVGKDPECIITAFIYDVRGKHLKVRESILLTGFGGV
jgi:predicted sulfurtransferase